ncbi:hypothetical protein K461DRAFT_142477 [Myriangium duriaei CBS 260.36]|uniref:Transcription factor domain-containing protein n=1 Tax=Myriangium duriaei CBS 260.36 TaxID=1168546 RepID=A0A9P4J706_9PEZI|nr:hypothetical protein K461DRAFT_142477 [Myriangium duriaei CBS 260.36]
MTVNTSCEDSTWQAHLNGLMAFMCKRSAQFNDVGDNISIVKRAIVSAGIRTSVAHHSIHADDHASSLGNALSILLVAVIRLRALSSQLDSIFNSGKRPRKLDVQKLRIAIKRLHRDLSVFEAIVPTNAQPLRLSTMILSPDIQKQSTFHPTAAHPTTYVECFPDVFVATMWNAYRAMLILTGGFLIESGQFLNALSKESISLSQSVQEAANAICAYTTHFATTPYPLYNVHIKTSDAARSDSINAIMLLWPIYAVAKSKSILEPYQCWARDMLFELGKQAQIPKAMALSQEENAKHAHAEITSGLLLVFLGFLLPGPS